MYEYLQSTTMKIIPALPTSQLVAKQNNFFFITLPGKMMDFLPHI